MKRGKRHEDAPDRNASPLSAQVMLVSTACWMGAYNTGEGYWITNRRVLYSPRVVTHETNEYDERVLTAFQKGYGIADRIAYKSWLTSISTTGMCRPFAPGGAWDVPTLLSDVHPAR